MKQVNAITFNKEIKQVKLEDKKQALCDMLLKSKMRTQHFHLKNKQIKTKKIAKQTNDFSVNSHVSGKYITGQNTSTSEC